MNQSDHLQRQRGLRILVVDDAPEVRQIFTYFLNASGMEVFEAENGTTALVAREASPPTSW